ncbi:MAG: hypothetical protein ABI284_01875 [Nitrosospira sp.]
MKYSLLAAVLVTLTFSACDQMREKTPGEGKPGQYPPSLWDKREGQLSNEEIDAAQKEDAAEAESKKSEDLAGGYTPASPKETDVDGKTVD